MTTENTIFDIAKVGRQIIINQAYYGMFLSTLNRKIDKNIPTAGVSKHGLNTQLTVNPDFWHKLPFTQKTGILIHELLHICLFHITTRQSFSDWDLFNIAADMEINQYIDDMKDVDLPAGCINLENYGFDKNSEAKKGTRYYYNKMHEKLQDGTACENLKELYQSMKDGKEVVCTHGTWKDFDELNESEKRVIEDQVKHQMKIAWENIDKSRGDIPNAIRNTLEELLKPKKSVFNWKAAVRRFTGGQSNETFTKKLRRKFNKRFEENPGLKIKHRKNLLCAVDTSGSVGEREFIEFMQEIDNVRKAGINVTVCECDAYVDKEKGVYQFKGLKHLTGRRVTGGGGTSFDPPIEFLNEDANKFSAIIYLTDGYAPVPKIKPRKPIMWVMSSDGLSVTDAKQQGFPGFIIKIPKEQ